MEERYFEESIQLVCQGDREGLRRIYEAYVGPVYTFVLGIVKNKEIAEDVTSEFFIRLWRIAKQYRPGYGHRTWMMTIAKHMAIDELRKQQRVSSDDEMPEQADKADTEKEAVGRVFFDEAMRYLDEQENLIITMKLVSLCTFREIADVLQIPMGTVTWKYNNGISKLRRAGYGK